MLAAPMARLQQETQAAVTTGQPKHAGIPCAMVYGLYVISPGSGLSCPRRLCDAKHHHELDASVAAPGPHDFAVRSVLLVAQHRRVHRIPPPTSVTTAKRPSDGGGMQALSAISEKWKEKYFRGADWTVLTCLSPQRKTSLSVHPVFRRPRVLSGRYPDSLG
jgi:hypothetical protein